MKTEKEYLEFLADINTPSLSSDNQKVCDTSLTLMELYDALNGIPASKIPGNNGLTKEFYIAFFDKLGPWVLKCLSFASEKGVLTNSQRQAVITPVEKKGRDKHHIKNWRPISLLNVDAKIISKVMANRLKKVIGTHISCNETAYVPGLFIGESLRLVSDLIEKTNIHNLPGYLVTIDIEKAFDSVDHKYLFAVLQKFGFGMNFTRWVKLIMNKQESCVINNGVSTGYSLYHLVPTHKGDPISAYLFILVMEILFIQVRSDKNIQGLKIFGYEFKQLAFTDNVSCFLYNLHSIEQLLKLLQISQEFTSLKVNYDKSEILV